MYLKQALKKNEKHNFSLTEQQCNVFIYVLFPWLWLSSVEIVFFGAFVAHLTTNRNEAGQGDSGGTQLSCTPQYLDRDRPGCWLDKPGTE